MGVGVLAAQWQAAAGVSTAGADAGKGRSLRQWRVGSAGWLLHLNLGLHGSVPLHRTQPT